MILIAAFTYSHLYSVFQFWALSPKITLCFLNDSITVSLMRAVKMKYVLCFHFQVEQNLKENPSLGLWLCLWSAGPDKKTVNIFVAESDTLTHLMATG